MKDQETETMEVEPKTPHANGSPSEDILPNLAETSGTTKEQIQRTMTGIRIDSVTLDELTPKILMAVRASTEQALNFGDEGFDSIIQPEENPRNYIWIGPVQHTTISDEPPLVATLFTQKIRRNEDGAVARSAINLVIAPAPIEKSDLIANYDDAQAAEEISFMVGFNWYGEKRHTLRHKYIAPKFRGKGLGSQILKIYEDLFQKMAEKNPQANIIPTDKLNTLAWAIHNGYHPDTNEDQKRWDEVGKRKTRGGEDIIIEKDGSIVIKPREGEKQPVSMWISLRKDFNPKDSNN